MTFTFEALPIENKEVLRQGILTLFGRDIATVSCTFSSRNYAFIFREGCFPAVIRVSQEMPHRGVKDILSELMWIDDLKKDVPNVCQPLPSLGHRMVERVAVGDRTYLVTMFRKANGAVLPEKEWNAAFAYTAGALLGKIHRTSNEEYQEGFRYKRANWDESPYYDFSCFDDHFDPSGRKDAETVLQRIREVPRDPRWYGMIHGDYRIFNLFCDWGDFWVFDFDDSCYGYFMTDIASILYDLAYGFDHSNITAREYLFGEQGTLTHFRAGYSSEYPLPEEYWEQLPDFFRLRIAKIISISIAHQVFPEKVLLALSIPSLELLKYDRDPVDKIEEMLKDVERRMPMEELMKVIDAVLS